MSVERRGIFPPTPDPRPSFVPSSLCENDREDKIRSSVGTDVQRRVTAENLGRPVARVVVQEWPTAFELVFKIR
jgi:hypothetical protein